MSYENPNPYGGPDGNYQPGNNFDDSETIFSALAYVPFLWLLGLLLRRNNPRVIFHVNQGIILTVFWMCLSIIIGIAKFVVSLLLIHLFAFFVITIFAGHLIVWGLSTIGWAIPTVFMIIGIVNAVQNRQKPLPIIGNLFTAVR